MTMKRELIYANKVIGCRIFAYEISLEKPKASYRECTACQSTKQVKEIFLGNQTTGSRFALCINCREMLYNILKTDLKI